MYAQKTLATIRVDTRSFNRVYFEEQNNILLPLDSLPCLPWQVYLSTCLLFSCRNVLNVTTLIRWERGDGGRWGRKKRWRRSGPELRVTLRFFMNRRRVTNFHCVISLFVRLLFFSYSGCYLSIFLAFYRTHLEQRDEQVSWLLLILRTSLIFFLVTCCAFVVDEFLFCCFWRRTLPCGMQILPEINSVDGWFYFGLRELTFAIG